MSAYEAAEQVDATSDGSGGLATLLVLVACVYVTYRIVRFVRMKRYFASDDFKAHKGEVAAVVNEHNEIMQYSTEVRNGGTFALGMSASGAQAHLASFQNTSHWKYRRDRNIANYAKPNVHNCSLQVVRNASADPIKYVMKYFNVRADEPTLVSVERLGESIARLEAAVENL